MLSPLIIHGQKLPHSNAHGNGILFCHSERSEESKLYPSVVSLPQDDIDVAQDDILFHGNQPFISHLSIFPWNHHILLFPLPNHHFFPRSIPLILGHPPHFPNHLKDEFHFNLTHTSEINTPSMIMSVLYQSFSEVLA
jgi:hypothetical protein